ncbi:MAG: DUF2784 domain-containing protein [Thermodesulfobacteriota bacterium]
MVYKGLADLVVLVHFLWILFLFIGALWGIRNKPVKIFHLSGLAFALLIQALDWYCPLTHLEIWLRSKHSPSLAYAGSFIIHYVEKIVYMEISRFVVLVFTILLCGLNAWLYSRKRRQGLPSPSPTGEGKGTI